LREDYEFQPPEQAGFRSIYGTIDHIHTMRQIIQKTEEYNQLLCLAFVDYEKAFDSVEIDEMRCLYESATISKYRTTWTIASRIETRGRHLPETVHKFNIGYIQDAELERTWHQHKWRVHLLLADDIVIMAETLQDN
jgi:hypothetical protein